MKKIAMLLVLCMTLMFFNGCVLKIPSISQLECDRWLFILS